MVAGMVEMTMHLDTTKLRAEIERMHPVKAMRARRYAVPYRAHVLAGLRRTPWFFRAHSSSDYRLIRPGTPLIDGSLFPQVGLLIGAAMFQDSPEFLRDDAAAIRLPGDSNVMD